MSLHLMANYQEQHVPLIISVNVTEYCTVYYEDISKKQGHCELVQRLHSTKFKCEVVKECRKVL